MRFRAHTEKAIRKAMEQTKDNQGLVLNFAMNYGSRVELVPCDERIGGGSGRRNDKSR